MSKLIDLTGKRFGRLVVIKRDNNTNNGIAQWECKCDCGRSVIARGDHLRAGHTKSCDCFAIDVRRKTHKTHGKSESRLYNIWRGMKERCHNSQNKAYHRYGGRGIAVCEEWLHDFQAFWDWGIVNGYRDDLSIDRIDNDRGYSPDNCRWSTQKEQNNNLSSNRLISIDTEIKTMSEWSEICGIPKNTIKWRLDNGWTPEEALGIVPRKKS